LFLTIVYFGVDLVLSVGWWWLFIIVARKNSLSVGFLAARRNSDCARFVGVTASELLSR